MRRLTREQKKEIKSILLTTSLTYEKIGNSVGCSLSTVSMIATQIMTKEERRKRFYANKSKVVRGPKHPNYKTSSTKQGVYITDIKPDWYTGRKNCERVYQHHLVYCSGYGLTEVPKGFVIRHIDGNKLNNNIRNLALMSLSKHTVLHSQLRATTIPKGSTPKWVEAPSPSIEGEDIV